MEHGKNCRAPSLEKGTSYVMKTWHKELVWEEVKFEGFVSNGQEYKAPNKQLKDMLPTDYYKFTGDAGAFTCKMLDKCLVHGTSEVRVTFFELLNASTSLATSVDETVETVEAAATETVDEGADEASEERVDDETVDTEVEVATDEVVADETSVVYYDTDYSEGNTVEEALAANDAAHEADAANANEATVATDEGAVEESEADRKRNLANEKKRASRAAIKAAMAAKVMPPSDEVAA